MLIINMELLHGIVNEGRRGGLLHMSNYENPFKKKYHSSFDIEIEEIKK